MAVWRIPVGQQDPRRYYPKPPYVEKRKCKAFRCKNRRSVSFPWVKKNPWCTDHSIQVYFAAQGWEDGTVKQQKQKAAEPPTNLFGWLAHRWRKRDNDQL